MTLRCPSCGLETSIVVNGHCIECGSQEIVQTIKQLQPDPDQ